MSNTSYLSRLFSVTDRTVLVTGGSRGIGLAIAKGFCQAGAAKVVLTSRDEKACIQAVEECNSSVASYIVSNLSTRQGCEDLAQQIGQRLEDGQRLDVLVNNAGTSWGEPLDRESGKRSNWGFDKVLDLNVKAVFYLTRACLPLMRRRNSALETDEARKDPARIINVGSVTGMVPQEAPTHAYDISKAAVHHLTRKLATDLAPQNITVNCVAPGYVPTRMSAGLTSWNGGDAETLARHIPLGRMGHGDDIAAACIYLASPAASWCTGVILNVDGGTVGAMQIPLSSL